MDLPRLKFIRCDVESRVHKHGAGLYMKQCLYAVEADVELPNVLMFNDFHRIHLVGREDLRSLQQWGKIKVSLS